MNRLVFDIETLAYPLDQFDAEQQEYLMKFARTDEERIEHKQRMSLTPLTAQVLAIGMLNPDTNMGKVLYQGPGQTASRTADGLIELIPLTEKEMLEEFWTNLSHYQQIVTFNGRSFDGPFLMLRSAMLGVKATRNLVPYRYETRDHCDLLDQLTFYGGVRKFNLDFYCKAFHIKSPKTDGITGLDLGSLFQSGHYKEIAEYCMGDVRATAELFRIWQNYIATEK